MKHFWKTNSDALLFKVQKEVKANTKERSRSSTAEGKRRWLKLFEPSRLDRDRRGSWSQRFTTVRKAYRFFSPSLSPRFLSWSHLLLISFLALPHLCFIPTTLFTTPPTPNCSNIISPPPVVVPPHLRTSFFSSLSLSCHCLSVGILSTPSVVCARYVWTHWDWDALKSSLI